MWWHYPATQRHLLGENPTAAVGKEQPSGNTNQPTVHYPPSQTPHPVLHWELPPLIQGRGGNADMLLCASPCSLQIPVSVPMFLTDSLLGVSAWPIILAKDDTEGGGGFKSVLITNILVRSWIHSCFCYLLYTDTCTQNAFTFILRNRSFVWMAQHIGHLMLNRELKWYRP